MVSARSGRALGALITLLAVLLGGPVGWTASPTSSLTAAVGGAVYSYDSASQLLSGTQSALISKGPASAESPSAHARATAQPRRVATSRFAAEAELPAGYSSFKAAKTGMGSPGTGNVFDHVVEQSQIGRSGFAPEEIHNPFNMNPVSAGTNELKANYYSTKQFFTGGGTVRDWLTNQSFSEQYEFGMDVLRRIENGIPLP